ncbi:hypothetical protein BT96DRAFT_948479 [Gymnopus androsaceus JB14]|uniref:Uncharacterized protein n=1 Tax=Gymnopus androsaceus JB14 TaxID=1447944 RepID=A0A6A4GPB2_9AGAR|nr:hypothetical protein BT96DRAFT_948479 [Gymnopus androsaceus JB14]
MSHLFPYNLTATIDAHPQIGKVSFSREEVQRAFFNETWGFKVLKRPSARFGGPWNPLSSYTIVALESIEQSKEAMDSAFHAIKSGNVDSGTHNVFEAKFIKDFRGPDGTLFVN